MLRLASLRVRQKRGRHLSAATCACRSFNSMANPSLVQRSTLLQSSYDTPSIHTVYAGAGLMVHSRNSISGLRVVSSSSSSCTRSMSSSAANRVASLRNLSTELLTRETRKRDSDGTWIQLPDLLTGSPAAATTEVDADATLNEFLRTRQTLPLHFHSKPILITSDVEKSWKKLNNWDRKQVQQSIEQEKREIEVKPSGSSILSSDATDGAPRAIGWSTRGLFFDGPNGVSKSTSLYSLACMARAENWLTVYISSGDQWVGELASGAASRMLIQAIYQAAANTIIPNTKNCLHPDSYLEMPLSPHLDYTATLIEQGISTFGELLTLSLELEDGLEETELSVECIIDQLFNIADVPVLIVVDGFDALTQKCLESANSASTDGNNDPAGEWIAPISVSPFSFVNYHRAPPFRGGFLLSGESFALVQQSQPELMERIHAPSASEMEEGDEENPMPSRGVGAGSSSVSTESRRVSDTFKQQDIDPIHVLALSPLSPSLSKAYILRELRANPSLAQSFLLNPSLPASYWSALFQKFHSGHFSLINTLLQLPLIASNELVALDHLHSSYLSVLTPSLLETYSTYFGTEVTLQHNLAAFFAQHLPQGFYRDFLRNGGAGGGGSRFNAHGAIARDYNLISVNSASSISQIQYIQQQIGSQTNIHSNVLTTSSAWQQLTAQVPWNSLNKSQLQLVQHLKVESFLQLLATGLLLQRRSAVNDSQFFRDHASRVASVSHWCATTDAPIAHFREFDSESLNCHWNLPADLEAACNAQQLQPIPHLSRLVHVRHQPSNTTAEKTRSTLTLLLPNLDPALSDLLIDNPQRPITALMHTLYLHYLSDILKAFEMCVGPTLQVRAKATDGSSYSWSELDDLVDGLQSGLFQNADELPLQQAVIERLVVVDAPTSNATMNQISSNSVSDVDLQVVLCSPHAHATISSSTQALPAPGSNPASLSTRGSVKLHPLFGFIEPLLAEDLASFLDLPLNQLQAIRWS